jgi:hypothetical protein
MSKKVTKITHSDGTEETVVTQTKGFFHYLGVFLAILFVLVMAVHTWWLGVIIILLCIIGIIGKIDEIKKS